MTQALARNLVLGVPLLVAAVAFLRASASARLTAGLATLVATAGVAAADAVAVRAGWWAFAPSDTAFLGAPVEVTLGWALAWGALPALLDPHLGRPRARGPGDGRRVAVRVAGWLAVLAWVDVLTMPRLAPLVVLHDTWLVGEAVVLLVVGVPAVLLGTLTPRRLALPVRVVLQLAGFGLLVLWLLPTIAFTLGDGSWTTLLGRPAAVRTAAVVAAAAVAVLPLSAVAELARVGHGTPWPWDPPDRLVTTGPYAYLANPMQVGTVLLLAALAVLGGSWSLGAVSLASVAFSAALAEPHERAVLALRWPGWAAYRREVRDWVPRRRPYAAVPATLWLSRTCGQCSDIERMLRTLPIAGLQLAAAEDAPVRLTRARWVGDGHHDRGVAAIARALEHSGLAGAWVGWAARLPLVVDVLQVIVDAMGGGEWEASAHGRDRVGG